jgi:hypothetical protein
MPQKLLKKNTGKAQFNDPTTFVLEMFEKVNGKLFV